ncbi:MAG: Flp1 family type IVb pilin [Bacillota bacterium]
MKEFLLGFLKDDDGMTTLEMIIIVVVLVGLAVAFRKQLVDWYNAILDKTPNPATEIPAINSKS